MAMPSPTRRMVRRRRRRPRRDKHELGEDDVKKPMVKLTKPGRKVARAVVKSYAPPKPAAVEKTVVKKRMKMRRKP